VGPSIIRAFRDQRAVVIGSARRVPAEEPDFLAADLTQSREADRLIRSIVERHARIDCVIHAMGGWSGGKSVAETSTDVWSQMIEWNASSAFHLFRAAIPAVAPGGRLIAIGAAASLTGASHMAAYAASKSALASLIQSAALELQSRAITANLIAPAAVDTEANRAAGLPASSLIPPEQIAALAVFLASEHASHISGAIIPMR
jgi:NAD(P)-dependent dehydrogenase (short-subunit alcohol dehydrogenase family)